MTVVTQPTGLLQSAVDGWSVEGSLLLLAVALVAGVGTVSYSSSASSRTVGGRAQYRLIIAAVGVLLFRSVVGTGTILGVVPMPIHHFLEHSLDFLIAAIVLYAVYAHAPGAVGNDAASD